MEWNGKLARSSFALVPRGPGCCFGSSCHSGHCFAVIARHALVENQSACSRMSSSLINGELICFVSYGNSEPDNLRLKFFRITMWKVME